jgi:hypothetical protein
VRKAAQTIRAKKRGTQQLQSVQGGDVFRDSSRIARIGIFLDDLASVDDGPEENRGAREAVFLGP